MGSPKAIVTRVNLDHFGRAIIFFTRPHTFPLLIRNPEMRHFKEDMENKAFSFANLDDLHHRSCHFLKILYFLYVSGALTYCLCPGEGRKK